MATYKNGRVLSIRIEPDLLEAVRERAGNEGRSVSGEIVFIIRKEIEAHPASGVKPRAISGWLGRRESPETYVDFAKARAGVSATLLRGVRRKARDT